MNVFVLEDDPERVNFIRARFIHTEADITVIESCKQADQFQPPYDLMLLDHDLGGRQMAEHEDCGATFVRSMLTRIPDEGVIVLHSFNPDGRDRMRLLLHPRPNVYVAPFRSAMFNRILATMASEAA